MFDPSKIKVLVVDDDSCVLVITRSRLESAGYVVVTRNEPIGTRVTILRERPDIILLDVNMPGLDGEALAAFVMKNEATRVPIVFHSSENLALLQAKARNAGVVGAISKTDDDNFFLSQFERLCRKAVRMRVQSD